MIKYLIIDDEHIAHDIIKGYCAKVHHMHLMKSCYDALEALDYLREHQVDLIFLDINMPKLKGFEFLKTLSNPPKVIVTTAYQEYALEGYALDVIDYLLKPFSFERFLKAIHKATAIQPNKASDTLTSSEASTAIFLYSDKKYTQIHTNEILYIEAAGNYVKVHTPNEVLTIRDKISDIAKRLPDNNFIQVHKSFVVSKQHIHIIEGNRIKIENASIPIGKLYKEAVMKLLR